MCISLQFLACRQLPATIMAWQASQQPIMQLANTLAACNSLQSPFARVGITAAAAVCSPCCGGAYLQQLSSVEPLLAATSLPVYGHTAGALQQQPSQTPPLQQLPPSRSVQHNPFLPPLRTQRSRAGSCRVYSTASAVMHVPEEPIIVAASWLGAKRGPFSK